MDEFYSEEETVPCHTVDEGTQYYRDLAGYLQVDLMDMEFKSSSSSYIPIRKIANGHFSTVYLSFDTTHKRFVALKISRADRETLEASQDEDEILHQIQEKIGQSAYIVELLDSFIYENEVYDEFEQATMVYRHYCFVFELLGHSLYKLMLRYVPKIRMQKAIPVCISKTVSKSLLHSVAHLHKCEIIHTDIKLENIVMKYCLSPLAETTDFSAADLLFGPISQELFDCKLATPAVIINEFDLIRVNEHDQRKLEKFMSQADQEVDKTNYKDKFLQLRAQHQFEPAQIYSCVYNVDGLNIFNIQNLLKEGEKLFRVGETDGRVVYPDSKINDNKLFTCDFRAVIAFLTNQTPNSRSVESPSKPIEEEIQVDKYQLINNTDVDLSSKIIKTKCGISFCCSRVLQSPNLNPRLLYLENVYSYKAEQLGQRVNLSKIAKKGLHSQVGSLRWLQKDSIGNSLSLTVKSVQKTLQRLTPLDESQIDDIKNFALSDNHTRCYPLMVSYFTYTQLIPFCEEMFAVKLLDLGNACYFDKHFSATIQTRQYRAPEILVGCGKYGYNELVDEFSVACVIFEMLTGNYLFNPMGDGDRERDENQLVLMVKTLGDEQLKSLYDMAGNDQKAWFVKMSDGRLKLRKCQQPIVKRIGAILVQDFNYIEEEAIAIERFLEPLLQIDPRKRRSCAESLNDPWLKDLGCGDYLMQYGGRKQV